MSKLIIAFVRDVLDQYGREEISFSRMVELLNEEVNKNFNNKDYEELYIKGYADGWSDCCKDIKLNEDKA